ncbi:MAG TPA: ATP-binding protein [Alphaproteobacteria bacterium]|nr:ATP-binding protein [Alphaproteobacteria bacterium]
MDITNQNIRAAALIAAVERFEPQDPPVPAVIKAVFSRQDGGDWTLLMATCVVDAPAAGAGTEDIYHNFAFVTGNIPDFRIATFLEDLENDGVRFSQNLPRVRDKEGTTNWTEEIVPSHVTRTGFPARRFSARLENKTHFRDGQLFGAGKAYYKSARRRISDFLDLNRFHGPADARKGELSIQISDKRGAIALTPEALSFSGPDNGLSLVGQINDDTPIELNTSATSRRLEPAMLGDVELWLLTDNDEIIDYRSTTEWPYRFETDKERADYAEELKSMIRGGESESCEFKKFIGQDDKRKAPDIEKTICAFSNLRGGMLFIGVDDEGNVVGIEREVEKAYRTNPEQAAALYAKAVEKRLQEALRDTQCFGTELVKLYASMVLVITATSSSGPNYLHESNEAYIRKGATNRKMSPPEIQAQVTSQMLD